MLILRLYQLDFGLDALGGAASATIFLDLDASAALQLSLTAASSATTTSNVARSLQGTGVGDGGIAGGARLGMRYHPPRTDQSFSAPNITGCIDVSSGFDVNAGAEGNLFGLFDASTKVTLFSKKFDLFKVCMFTTLPS